MTDGAVAAAGDTTRLVEALLFASARPLDEAELTARLPAGSDATGALRDLAERYADRGVNLVRVAEGWAFRTAADLAAQLRDDVAVSRKPSRATTETLAIIAYHQPVTRGEIEAIRGVATSRGTLDLLMEAGWIRPGRRRETAGRPVTWVTTREFLDHFSLGSLDDLPGVAELKAAGLMASGPVATLPGGRIDLAEPAADADPDRAFALELGEEMADSGLGSERR